MPRGKKKKEDKLDTVLNLLVSYGERLSALESKLQEAPKVEEKKEVVEDKPVEFQPPIPVEFREVVDEVLNRKFDVKLNYYPDRPEFEFAVLVPREYSNANQSYWDTFHSDTRLKVIENAMGAIGVREYVQQVRENLGPDVRTRIDLDRAKLAGL